MVRDEAALGELRITHKSIATLRLEACSLVLRWRFRLPF
jgi:hypothetical protein